MQTNASVQFVAASLVVGMVSVATALVRLSTSVQGVTLPEHRGGTHLAEIRHDTVPSHFAHRTLGSSAAPVTVYEFSDFECPYCRQFVLETFPAISQRYIRSARVQWVFVNDPKTRRHLHAARAAEFALCVATQDKFWPYHNLLFRYQDAWSALDSPDSALAQLADSVHANRAELLSCVAGGRGARDLEADRQYVARLGDRGVPAFIVSDTMVAQGALPTERFVTVFDSLLQRSSR